MPLLEVADHVLTRGPINYCNSRSNSQRVTSLARAGAKLDREHWRDPEGDADGMLEAIDGDPRVLAALRGEPIDIDNTGSRV